MWLDGICKKCGSLVAEESSENIKDYQNRCLNSKCDEHKWHYVYDDEELDYYEHGPSISKRIVIKEKGGGQIK